MDALENGNWRAALRLGGPEPRYPVVHLLALGMEHRAHGRVARSWSCLAQAAAVMPHQPKAARAAVSRRSADDPRPLFPTSVSAESVYGQRPDLWRLLLIGRREEEEHRDQRRRIRTAERPKRQALIEACIDHLVWVDFDPWTWPTPVPDGVAPHPVPQLPGAIGTGDAETTALGETGRTDLLRRASELHHSVHAISGDISRSVWDSLGGYTGVRALALHSLAERGPWEQQGAGRRCRSRVGCLAAQQFALTWRDYQKG